MFCIIRQNLELMDKRWKTKNRQLLYLLLSETLRSRIWRTSLWHLVHVFQDKALSHWNHPVFLDRRLLIQIRALSHWPKPTGVLLPLWHAVQYRGSVVCARLEVLPCVASASGLYSARGVGEKARGQWTILEWWWFLQHVIDIATGEGQGHVRINAAGKCWRFLTSPFQISSREELWWVLPG